VKTLRSERDKMVTQGYRYATLNYYDVARDCNEREDQLIASVKLLLEIRRGVDDALPLASVIDTFLLKHSDLL
jgi:hypothetical protein